MKVEKWLLQKPQIEILMVLNSKLSDGARCVGECFGVEKGDHCADGCYICIQKVLKREMEGSNNAQ